MTPTQCANKKTPKIFENQIEEKTNLRHNCVLIRGIWFNFLFLFYVTVPPDILDYPTSTDMVVKEGSNVTLKCSATGSPPPTITFRREDGEPIKLPGGIEGKSI